MTPKLEKRLCEAVVRLTEETAVMLMNQGALVELFARRVPGLSQEDVTSLLKQSEVCGQLARSRTAEANALRQEFEELQSPDESGS